MRYRTELQWELLTEMYGLERKKVQGIERANGRTVYMGSSPRSQSLVRDLSCG